MSDAKFWGIGDGNMTQSINEHFTIRVVDSNIFAVGPNLCSPSCCTVCCVFGSVGPIPKLDVSTLGIISNTVPDSDNKVFIGGLPYNLTEDQASFFLALVKLR